MICVVGVWSSQIRGKRRTNWPSFAVEHFCLFFCIMQGPPRREGRVTSNGYLLPTETNSLGVVLGAWTTASAFSGECATE